jgi:hypothetical protein
MAKKPRPEPFSEGSIADIYKLFFGKLIFYKPESMSIQEWMEHLFDFANRDIIRFVAVRPFSLPGLYYAAGSKKVQGMGYRKVELGDVLWVRLDARNPDTIDVEIFSGQGNKDQVFALDALQWEWTKLHLREEERERKRR